MHGRALAKRGIMSLTEQIGWIILSIALSAAVVGAIWIMVHRYRQKLRRAAERGAVGPGCLMRNSSRYVRSLTTRSRCGSR